MNYGLDALRRYREKHRESHLIDVNPDAPVEKPEQVLHAWAGGTFVPWQKWLATDGVVRGGDPPPEPLAGISHDATCVIGICGGIRIWLVKDGERWLMHVGTRKPKARRRDFATPFLEHAITTAEHWYGAAEGNWRAEKNSDGSSKAQDLHPQAEDEHEGRTRGNDELALDGR